TNEPISKSRRVCDPLCAGGLGFQERRRHFVVANVHRSTGSAGGIVPKFSLRDCARAFRKEHSTHRYLEPHPPQPSSEPVSRNRPARAFFRPFLALGSPPSLALPMGGEGVLNFGCPGVKRLPPGPQRMKPRRVETAVARAQS